MELLVVIGIIAALIAIFMPGLAAARRSAMDLTCQNNMRQVGLALVQYAIDNRGCFPQNLSMPPPGRHWYKGDQAGKYLGFPLTHTGLSPVLTCPNDDGAGRSYAMNVWASSKADGNVFLSTTGQLFRYGEKLAARLMLVCESWATTGAPGAYATPTTIGFKGSTPGQRFGVGGGLTPAWTGTRFGTLSSELCFARHRRGQGSGTAPVGRTIITFADGHVEILDNEELADANTGKSRLRALWSPKDEELNTTP